jgi:hypothetical protein
MRRYSNDSYFTFSGAVTPKNPMRAGGVLLGVSYEDLLVFLKRMGHGHELVGLQAGVSRILLKRLYALANLLEQALVPGSFLAFGL